MENSDRIWQWSRAGKKLFLVSKIHSLADGFSQLSPNFIRTGKPCIDDYHFCWPVQNSVAEVRQCKFEEVPRNFYCGSSSSATNSDTVPATWPCHPPACKKPKRNQSLVSETSQNHFEIEEQKAKTEFPGLHLLADVAVRCLENDVVASPENSLTEEKGIRKAIFTPTGLPFLQKRVPRTESTILENEAEGNEDSMAIPQVRCSKRSRSQALPSKYWDFILQIENEAEVNEDSMAIPQVRCSKRSRSQALPSKYRDFILQPWK